jgi:Ca2+-transporting ATPase
VTKEASDMVVTDDNFASIAAAVETGRGIYANILKSIQYLISGNIGEVLVMLFSTLFAFPLPLLPVHILWINLVTDSLPALALSVDPSGPEIMRQPPRRTDARILDRYRMSLMFMQGLFLATITLLAFAMSLYLWHDPLERARTVAFTVLVASHVVHAFNCRSNDISLLSLGVHTNKALLAASVGSIALHIVLILLPWTQPILKAVPLTPVHWWLIAGCAVSPVVAMELWKRRM